MSLNKTKIEWTDYTWNPVTGCKHGCPYCYARSIANRFKGSKAWPNGFEPTFHPERLIDVHPGKARHLLGKKVFVCSMADLFGDWVPDEWIDSVIEAIDNWSVVHDPAERPIFQFLTKNPKRYEDFAIPENCWLGTTVESEAQAHRIDELNHAVNYQDNYAFVSFEPLLGKIDHPLKGLDWIIIGAQTGPGAKYPDKGVLDSLMMRAFFDGIPIFTKDSLKLDSPIREFPNRSLEVEP
ncbi:MAG: Phage protein Gp37/Gp68 [Methanomassiliicoccales archaeon PtaB.Bin215]|nr:MAG: Phage protein Gp37/Gp68 [Methanomassiliicoccales archaeon PtaB.Bin215]